MGTDLYLYSKPNTHVVLCRTCSHCTASDYPCSLFQHRTGIRVRVRVRTCTRVRLSVWTIMLCSYWPTATATSIINTNCYGCNDIVQKCSYCTETKVLFLFLNNDVNTDSHWLRTHFTRVGLRARSHRAKRRWKRKRLKKSDKHQMKCSLLPPFSLDENGPPVFVSTSVSVSVNAPLRSN